jgi:hypothetical protein
MIAFLIPALVFAQQVEPHSLGLSKPSLAEMAESARTMAWTQKVLPNKLAIDRLNAERLVKGQPPVHKIPPALLGEDIVTAFSATAMGSASDVNLGSAALASLAGRVDNSALAAFPPIRSQGDIGSCASFSSTYYVGTHMLALARGTNTKNSADNSNKLSPKFTYALVNWGEDEGSSIVSNLQTLVNLGAPAWSSFAYVGVASNPANYLEWPRVASVWREAALNRFKETGVVANIHTAAGLENARGLLANGYLLLFGTDIYAWDMTTFSNDPATTADNDLVGKQVCRAVGNNPSGHAMTVVGYDDHVWTDINRNGVVDAGEKGAFKIANSWGNNWGDGGFVWFAYAALKNSPAYYGAFYSNAVYWITARTNYTPSLLAEFTLSHAQRNQLTLRLGRGGTSSISPQESSSPSFFSGLGGARAFDGSTNAQDGTFVFDFTDLVRSGVNRYFLSTTDSPTSGAAQVKSFRLTSPSGVPLAQATMNVPAPVDGATVHSYVDFGGSAPAPVITSSLSAAGQVGQAFSYTISASNSPTSYSASGLPAGLTLQSASISGTPTQAGTFSVQIGASNSAGTGSAALQIQISPILGTAPVITSNSTASAQVGGNFSYTIVATNSPTSYGASGLPSGLSLNATTGVISGKPTQAGTYALTLEANNAGGTGTRILVISVVSAVLPVPEIISQTVAQGVSGAAFSYRIEATNSPTGFGALDLPSGLTLNSTTGVISGMLPSARVYEITLTASNASGTVSKKLTLTVTGSAIEGPTNDDFSNRIPLIGANVTTTGSNQRSSTQPSEPSLLGQSSHSVWWTWTAPRSSSVTISLAGSSFNTVLGVYTGTTIGALTEVAANDDSGAANTSQVTFNATAGTTYQICVLQGSASPPQNDQFANRQSVSGEVVSTTGSSFDASAEAGEPAHYPGQAATKSVWWTWTAPSNARVTINTVGSAFDTLLAVYTGQSLDSLISIALNDDSGGVATSQVVFRAVAGTTYQIAVDGYNGATGQVALTLDQGLDNDDFENRATLSGNYSSVSGTNSLASAETDDGEPAHAGQIASRSIWWTWTPSYSGAATISTIGSQFDTLLAVYTGQSLATLSSVASDDQSGGNNTSQVVFQAVAGTTYQIAVDGFRNAAGEVTLTLYQAPDGVIYEADFEMFPLGINTLGFDGWDTLGFDDRNDDGPNSGTSGIFEPGTGGQAAWIGYNPTRQKEVYLYRRVNVPSGTGVVEFSVDLRIVDSTSARNYRRDVFGFPFYNSDGIPFGEIFFDNDTQKIILWEGGEQWIDTGHSFVRDADYTLSVTMDLDKKKWTAYLGEQLIFKDATMNSTGLPRNLGGVAVRWVPISQGYSGDNFMVFDNFRLSTTKQTPVILSASAAEAKVGEPFTYKIAATHAPHLSFNATGLPPGLNLNSSTGWISGTPSDIGTKPIMLTATNSQGSGSKLLLLSVGSSSNVTPTPTPAPAPAPGPGPSTAPAPAPSGGISSGGGQSQQPKKGKKGKKAKKTPAKKATAPKTKKPNAKNK